MSDLLVNTGILINSYIIKFCKDVEKSDFSISYYTNDVPSFVIEFNNNLLEDVLNSLDSEISSKLFYPSEHAEEIQFLKLIQQYVIKLTIEVNMPLLLSKVKLVDDIVQGSDIKRLINDISCSYQIKKDYLTRLDAAYEQCKNSENIYKVVVIQLMNEIKMAAHKIHELQLLVEGDRYVE